MRFCTHVPNSPKNKNLYSGKPYLCPKMVFWAPKILLYLLGTLEKTSSFTLDLMILLMVRNECLRFGRHAGKQVSNKILRLEVLKYSVFSHLTLFSTWADLRAILTKTTSRLVGVKWWHTYQNQWKWYNSEPVYHLLLTIQKGLGNTILLKSKIVFVND